MTYNSKTYQRVYYRMNKEKMREKQRQYYLRNRERILAKQKLRDRRRISE